MMYLQKKALSQSLCHRPILRERVAEAFPPSCISKGITLYFARRLTLNSTQRNSVGGNLAWTPWQTKHSGTMRYMCCSQKETWFQCIGSKGSWGFCTALASLFQHLCQYGISVKGIHDHHVLYKNNPPQHNRECTLTLSPIHPLQQLLVMLFKLTWYFYKTHFSTLLK